MHVEHLITVKSGGPRDKEQVADVRQGLALAHSHVDLATGVAERHLVGRNQEVGGKVLATGQVVDGVDDAAVGDDAVGRNQPAVNHYPAHPALVDDNALRLGIGADGDSVFYQFIDHQADEPVGAALEGEDPLVHEVGKDDTIGDGRVVKGGAVGIGDGLHEQPVHVWPVWKELLEQLPGGDGPVVVKVHGRDPVEESGHRLARYLEVVGQQRTEILAVKGGAKFELGIVKDNTFELDNGVHDRPVPIFPAGLYHAKREAVQRDVEDVAPPFEPGGQAAHLMVVLQQQNLVAGPGQAVGHGEPSQAGADDYGIVAASGGRNGIMQHGLLLPGSAGWP